MKTSWSHHEQIIMILITKFPRFWWNHFQSCYQTRGTVRRIYESVPLYVSTFSTNFLRKNHTHISTFPRSPPCNPTRSFPRHHRRNVRLPQRCPPSKNSCCEKKGWNSNQGKLFGQSLVSPIFRRSVGGWVSTHLKNMRTKMGSSSPK